MFRLNEMKENINYRICIKCNSLIEYYSSETADSVNKEEVKILCNKLSDFLLNRVITITSVEIQQQTSKYHGLDTSVGSHVKRIIARRKCLLYTHQRLRQCM